MKKDILPYGFECLDGNFSVAGILADTGIKNDPNKLTLFALDPECFCSFEEAVSILIKFTKFTEIQYVSWQEVLVDLNFLESGNTAVLQKWQISPIIWNGDITFCYKNQKIIEKI